MKKLVLFFALATAVAFASCGNKEAKTCEQTCEEAAVEVVAVEEVPAEEAVVAEEAPVAEEVVAEEAVVEEVAE
ncbi:MAG: hypothetical protein R3Y59_10180 [bacterium]